MDTALWLRIGGLCFLAECLACHGLDNDNNDFVIGLLGKRLHPLSALVERMRGTVQTSTYMEHMGPFFIGRTVWQGSGE